MAPTVVCPRCDNKFSPRLIQSPSAISVANYYRCTECSHVWAVDEDNPASIHHVTPLEHREAGKS